MKVIIVGLGVQGKKRMKVAGKDVVATVDPFVKQASHNLFVSNPDQELIFQKITSFFNQFRGN